VTALRLIGAVLLAALPSWAKIPVYRHLFGYTIGRGVKIGLSPFFRVGRCAIGDHARIGSFNLFARVEDLAIGEHARVGHFNLFRGGSRLAVGPYATVLRLNVFNAIDGDYLEPVDSVLELGAGTFVATGHWLDFGAGIRVGDHSIIGGRHSSFWTHNRQRGRPITVGRHTYLGSEVRVAPGAEIPAYSVVALGSVVSGQFADARVLIGGNPAQAVRPLRDDDLFLVVRKTRDDLPDALVLSNLPDDLQALFARAATASRGSDVGPP
jgi:acetyltransferase-like isoleucine patch superfamily enzyme